MYYYFMEYTPCKNFKLTAITARLYLSMANCLPKYQVLAITLQAHRIQGKQAAGRFSAYTALKKAGSFAKESTAHVGKVSAIHTPPKYAYLRLVTAKFGSVSVRC